MTRQIRAIARLAAALAACVCMACAGSAPIDVGCLAEAVPDVAVGSLERAELDARLDALQLDNEARERAIETLFREAGCDAAALRLEAIPGTRFHNVICTIPGASARRIVIGAHHDKVDLGAGAADNWSGAALLPSLYRSLTTRERAHTIELIAFGAEEEGLVGSRAHVAALDAARIAEIAAMINLDTLGLGATKVERRTSDPRLLCLVLLAGRLLDAPIELVNADRVGTSDFAPFRTAGVPVVSIHSISQSTFGVLHGPRDQLSAIDRDAYDQTYRLIATYVALLDALLP